jgi:aryl-alcohol dehydrogenase-like predicted oxidoreductase
MEQLPFGRTGHHSSRIIFGAAALGSGRSDLADRVLAEVVRHGINHIDTAAGYGDSELALAPWLRSHRSRVFLATKTGERSGDGARAQLERSLTRLGVDSVDLIQLHNLVEPDEWETAFATNGAVAALSQAQAEGLCRHIGITGHGLRIPSMHIRSLERFDFASVLFPLNYSLIQHQQYRRDVYELMDLCTHRGVAMQTIKSIARRRWPAGADAKRFSWYEPLQDPGAIDRAVRFALAVPNVFVNSSSDARLLGSMVAAANSSEGVPSDEELAADSSSFDVTPLFDGAVLERI